MWASARYWVKTIVQYCKTVSAHEPSEQLYSGLFSHLSQHGFPLTAALVLLCVCPGSIGWVCVVIKTGSGLYCANS